MTTIINHIVLFAKILCPLAGNYFNNSVILFIQKFEFRGNIFEDAFLRNFARDTQVVGIRKIQFQHCTYPILELPDFCLLVMSENYVKMSSISH